MFLIHSAKVELFMGFSITSLAPISIQCSLNYCVLLLLEIIIGVSTFLLRSS